MEVQEEAMKVEEETLSSMIYLFKNIFNPSI